MADSFQNPTAICSGIETSTNCGCSSFGINDNWERNNAYCVIDTRTEIQRVLTNLGLGWNYATDGFGNPVTIVPIADANGNPVNCPPPRPQPNYPILNLGKKVIGVRDALGNWIYYIFTIL